MPDLKHVKGLSELERALEALPLKLARNSVRAAMRAGAKLTLTAVRANVPVGPPSVENARIHGGYAGALRDSIRLSTRVKGLEVTAKVSAGGSRLKGVDTYYALWVEVGTRRHLIRPSGVTYNGRTYGGAQALTINGRVVAAVMHPGAKARPFMRPALDSTKNAVLLAIATDLKDRLATKHGLDTADIELGVE